MHKRLYRTVESLLARIDHSAGDEKMLVDILQLLVHSPETQSFGVVSGRLYREEPTEYRLIESIGEHGPAIAGKTAAKGSARFEPGRWGTLTTGAPVSLPIRAG